MNEQSSRWFDRFVGVPLCFLFTLWCRLTRPKLRGPVSPPKNILFVKLSEMGAIILTIPAFEEARRRVGREGLFMVMLQSNRHVHDLLGMFPDDHIFTIRDRNLFTFAWDVGRFIRACRKHRIEAVLDLEGFARISALLSFLSGARIRVGWHRFAAEGNYRGDLFTHRIACNTYQHASEQFMTLVKALDADPADMPLLKAKESAPLVLPDNLECKDEESLREIIALAGGEHWPRPWVIFNPNLIDLLPLRRWPAESFVELGTQLLHRHPTATILLTGLPAERAESLKLARQIDPHRVHSLAGMTKSLRGLTALVGHADLLVTSDCGTAHMAALTDTPIVSLFGPETPQLYSPLSPRNISLWAGIGCSPCLNAYNQRRSVCHNNVCMQLIRVEDVLSAMERTGVLATESS